MSLEGLRGAVVWITGVPASGKTTLARGLRATFAAQGLPTLWLDSDDLRPVLAPNAGYGAAGRDAFYAALAHLARLGAQGGVTVLISATASRRTYRDTTRAAVAPVLERLPEWARQSRPAAVREHHRGQQSSEESGARAAASDPA